MRKGMYVPLMNRKSMWPIAAMFVYIMSHCWYSVQKPLMKKMFYIRCTYIVGESQYNSHRLVFLYQNPVVPATGAVLQVICTTAV